MERIQILSQMPLYYLSPGTVLICIGVCLILFGVISIILFKKKKKIDIVNIISPVVVSILCGLLMSLFFTEPTSKYEYKVIVDDTISVNEFISEYEIISYDGQIFTVREKEQER